MSNNVVKDYGTPFVFDGTTKQITNSATRKPVLVKGDHNCEQFTFECSRYVEGYDLSKCTKIEIHYINGTGATKSPGIYTVEDAHIGDKLTKPLTFTWLLSKNATTYAGVLSFKLRFVTLNGEEIEYELNSEPYVEILVADTQDNSEDFEEANIDIIEQWKNSVMEELSTQITSDVGIAVETRTSVLETRMNTFTQMSDEGMSTAAEAELYDIRVGFDGTTYPNAGTAVREQVGKLSEDIVAVEEKAEDRLNAYINGVMLEWTAGNISSDGVITDGATQQNNYYSSVIPKELIERVTLNLTSWRYGSYCLYQNGVFVSRAAWLDKTELKQVKKYVIDNQCDVRLLIATNPTYMAYDANARIGLTAEEVLEGFEITIDEKTAKSEFEKSNKKITFLDKIMCCDFGGKLMHFSIDDVYTCLYDLTTGSYSSIFDQRLFKALKGVHDATGACFTLNCFNTCTLNAGFNLANVPSTWQAEFQANKSWLRFAFHGEDDNSAYATTTGAKDSYERFVNSIYNITGDYGCIDRITRLGFFSGSLENVLALKNANYGIIGLLTADDERLSYYFDETQNNLVLRKGKYYDLDNELVFIRSIPRIDNRLSSTIKEIVESNLCYQKTTELFIHENGFATDSTLSGYMGTITSIAEWANENGYKHGFACDVYE